MKTKLHSGDRVKILIGKLFKDTEATIEIEGTLDGRKMYKVIIDSGLTGWYHNSELELINI